MKKLDIKEIKRPDTLQETLYKIAEQIAKNSHIIIGAVVLALIVSISVISWNWYQDSNETKGQTALFRVEKSYLKKKEDFARADQQDKAAKANDKSKSKEEPAKLAKATGNLDQDYGPEVRDLQAVISKYPRTRAAVMAALDLADLFDQYKQPAEALNQISKVSKSLKPKELLFGVLMMKKGSLESVKGDCESAVKTWNQILDQANLSFFHPDATLRSAICFEQLNNVARAKELYQRTHDKFPESSAGQSAQKYLQLLEMKHSTEQGPS